MIPNTPIEPAFAIARAALEALLFGASLVQAVGAALGGGGNG